MIATRTPPSTEAPTQDGGKKEEEEEDDFDPFADDGEADSAPATKTMSRKERIEAAKQEKQSKKKQDRTQIIVDVKPTEIEVDLNQLWANIQQINIDGLTWGEGFEIEPVAFGICKVRSPFIHTSFIVYHLVGHLSCPH